MSDVRWAVRLRSGGAPWVQSGSKRWDTDVRSIAYQEAGRHADSRVVKITRKPKAKVVGGDAWAGTVYEFGTRVFHIRHADNTSSSSARFNSWLMNNEGKRVRVTLEVLES